MTKTRFFLRCAAIGLAMALCQHSFAITRTVTSTADDGPGTLRQALVDANDGDVINFMVTGTIQISSGQLTIDDSITIQGPGSNHLTIDANSTSRVFFVNAGNTVTISGLTITHGNPSGADGGGIYNDRSVLTVNLCVIDANNAFSGGGIFNNGVTPSDGPDGLMPNAVLTANFCPISNNVA